MKFLPLPAGRWRRLATPLALAGLLLLDACGGSGGGVFDPGGDGGTAPPTGDPFVDRLPHANVYANYCAAPRSGRDPYNDNQPYPDRQGTLEDEKDWVRAFMGDIYYWYDEIPNVDSGSYTVANDGSAMNALNNYFEALKTPNRTASGKLKDEFSFTYPTADYNAMTVDGVEVGYGMQVQLIAASPPRKALVAFSDPGSPAAQASITRGAEIVAIDGASFSNGDPDTLNAGLFPSAAGEQHNFSIRDLGASSSRTVTLTAQQIDSQPVQNVKTIPAGGGTVGYLLFNAHIATAEGALYRAFTQLRSAGVTDLVLDLRYNGGGYLDIAAELGYMIAGPARTTSRAFEKLAFNDKNPLGDEDTTTPFYSTTQNYDASVPDNTPLPTLNLARVYVLTGANTCSASEAIVNGLRGVDVAVTLVGDTTCGKPYGFFPTDNCGLSYFAIEFAGVNAKNFGDYADGFAPTATCAVADDFSHALGDPAEGQLAAALRYRSSGSCTPPATATAGAASTRDAPLAPPQPSQVLRRSPLLENRLYRPNR